jgi:hypothetical protein
MLIEAERVPKGMRRVSMAELRCETTAFNEVVADLTLENRLLKKSMNRDGGGRRMRY